MTKWQIVADSSCDLFDGALDRKNIAFSTVPLKIVVGEKEFIDREGTDPLEMLKAMKSYKGASSSACPSPEEFAEHFRRADYSFAVTMTGSLSGTYNSAMQAKRMVLEEFPEKKIHVVDTKSTSGSLVLTARKIISLIEEGKSFEEIVPIADEYGADCKILFSLTNFDNLIKNGRMSRMAGIMASALHIRPIGLNPNGVIEIVDKPRGEKRAIERMVEMMPKYGYKSGDPIVLSHCSNPEGAKTICELIKSQHNADDNDITVLNCACLTSFYSGERGLLLCF